MASQPEVTVIIPNYNGKKLLENCIQTLEKQTCTDFKLLVVDNGSDDGSTEVTSSLDLTMLALKENTGFCGAVNEGIRHADTPYVILLNNDTEVADDTLHHLCDTLDADPAIGAVCPKIRFHEPPQAIQFAGYTPLTRITLRNALIGFGEPDSGRFDTPHDTPYAHGAAMMVRREAIERAGMMPEEYFLYYEELDWSVRIREQGRRIVYDPRCTVFHKESATTGQQSPLRSYCLTRNRLLFAWRNLRGGARLLSVAYQLCIAAPKNAVSALAHRRGDLAKAVCRGVRDFFTLKNKQA